MKLLAIDIEGFGPFKDVQKVDFTEFDDYGIFLIGGRTGAGKSTILDAVCFALYGTVPRYDDYSGTARLRSDHCTPEDPTTVTLTFEARGTIYRVTRSPEYERPKLRGEGLARQAPSVLLEQQTGDGWEGLETRAREVAELISEIVKLDKKEFLQVALLAQNRFQRFLEAESRDRQDLLRRLFGTRRFDQYTEALALQTRALTEQMQASADTAERIVTDLCNDLDAPPPERETTELDWAKDLTAAAAATASQTQRAERDEEQHSRAAATALTQAQELDRRQRQRAVAAAGLAALELRAAETDGWRRQLKVARTVAELHPYASAERDARQRLEAAQSEQAAATEACPAVPDGDLREHAGRLAETIGSLSPLVQIEALELPRIQQHAEQARAALRGAREKAAVEAEQRTKNVNRCKQLEIDALATLSTASSEEQRLRDAHLHGRAAILAEQLRRGDPCPVCGASEHPAPALFIGQPVTDQDLEAAEQRRQEAQRALDAASRKRAEAETQAALLAAGSEELRAHETAVSDAEKELARAARAIQENLGGYRSIAARVQDLTQQRNTLERLADARRELARATAEHTTKGEQFQRELEVRGFADRRSAAAVALPKAERDRLDELIGKYDAERNGVTAVLALSELQGLPEQRPDIEALSLAAAEAAAAYRGATEQRVRAVGRATRSRELTVRLEQELESSAETRAQLDLVEGLARAAKGDAGYNRPGIPLERFVLAAELEEIVAAANVRLRAMSQGRYTIEHSDDRTRGGKSAGLELVIYDAHTGAPRVPQSLSGGEKFLASLALALGMAEVVTDRAGGIKLDTLFIDEGFGSLDGETLEIAMQTLDQLRQGGRTVGLISHVEAMQEQIPAKLEVTVKDNGSSKITARV
jgi:DNA repair protein SbcC/Rad50